MNKNDYDNLHIMVSEPAPEMSVDDVRIWLDGPLSEKELAEIFAAVSNKFWWVEDNEYDFEEGTEEYKEAVRITDEWGCLMYECLNRIFDIMKSEGVTIPDKGYNDVLIPFMTRNGFKDGSGWWIEEESE